MWHETRDKYLLNLPIAVAAAVGLGFAAPASAQVDTSEWECQFCPFPDGYDASVEPGAVYVSDDAVQLGDGTGLDEKGGYVNLDGEGLYASDGYRLEWMADDLGLDARRLGIDGGKPGRFGFHIDYSETPYRRFDTTSTPFTAASADTLTLPAGWVRASQTSGLTSLQNSLQPVDIESDRSEIGIGGDFLAGSGFSLYADFRRQQKDGVDIVSASNFVQGTMLPRPFDYETDLVDVGIEYANGGLSLALGWFGSYFSNNAASLTWDNPFTSFPGADQGRLAQEPDNEYQQLSLSGSYFGAPLDSVVAFSVAIGEGEQTQALLPYTINPVLAAGALPRASLGGSVDTANYAFTLTSRPLPKARVAFSYRYDERDNQTPRSAWSRVVVDGFLSGDSEMNVPYSYEKQRLSLEATYRLFDDLRLAAGYDRTDFDRTFQAVTEQSEDTGWGQLRWRPMATLEIDLRGGASKRENDQYDEALAIAEGQNPLLRKYNLAYRYREFAEAMLAFSPSALPVSATVSVLYGDDSYTESELGLISGEQLHVAADVNWTISEDSSLYVNVSSDDIEAEQTGSALFAAPDWRATHDDGFLAVGVGFRKNNIAENVDFVLDYVRSSGETDITVTRFSTSPSPLPTLQSDLDDLRIGLTYRRSESFAIDADLRWWRLETEDWALEGVDPATVSSVLALGAKPYDEDALVFVIGFRYALGSDED